MEQHLHSADRLLLPHKHVAGEVVETGEGDGAHRELLEETLPLAASSEQQGATLQKRSVEPTTPAATDLETDRNQNLLAYLVKELFSATFQDFSGKKAQLLTNEVIY